MFLNREMSLLRRDVELDVEPGDLAQGAWDREQVRVLFDQLAFRTLLPAAARGGRRESAADADAGRRRSTSRSTSLRDAGRGASRCFDELAAAGERVRARAALGRRRRSRSRCARSRLARRRRRGHVRRRRRCSRDPAVRDALDELVGDGGPPLVAHRAKELMHGLDVDVRIAAPRHRGDGVPARSRPRGSTCSRTSRCGYLSLEVQSPDAEPGTLDLDGEVGDRGDRPARRGRAAARRRARRRRSSARELTDLYERFERPLVRVLAQDGASRHPHRPRVPRRAARRARRSSATTLVQRIYAHAGEEFNVNSTPQLRTILFEKLGLVPVKKTKTGPSTDADSLQKMADEHPIVEDLLRYREVEKLRSTYADALPPLDRAPTAASTPRSSRPTPPPAASRARRPNLQNVPVRTADGREIRRRVHRRRRLRGCSPPTTRRSSCACSRTSPRTRA